MYSININFNTFLLHVLDHMSKAEKRQRHIQHRGVAEMVKINESMIYL